jgi:Zn2+/Cd2+-exporting ATPase
VRIGLDVMKVTVSAVLLVMGLYLKFVSGADDTVQLAVFGIAYVICIYDIVVECVRNIRHGDLFDENLLTLIATFGAFAIGEYPEGLAVVLFFIVGEMFEGYAIDRSRRSISALMDIVSESANVIRDGKVMEVDSEDVHVDELIVIKPGEKVPLDCVIIDGSTSMDTKTLTGESMSRDVDAGDELLSGFINLSAKVTAKVTKVYEDSAAARIMGLIEDSASRKARSERFITIFARYYTPAVCLLAFLVAFVPIFLFGQDVQTWIYRALTLLVVSCPCALVISIPMGFFCGMGCASKFGILVKGGNYLEMLAKTDTVVFDKTGTLTKGSFSVSNVHSHQMSEDELVQLAAEAEFYSDHPISMSIKEKYGKDIDPTAIGSSKIIPGKGVVTEVRESMINIGNSKMMKSIGQTPIEDCCKGTKVHLASENGYLGHISVSDKAKDDSRWTIDSLRHMGVRTVMLTGDNREVADDMAERLGLDEVFSELLPEDKLAIIEEIISKSSGSTVFVGDGINDAPSLARSDVGIAMGGIGSDVAIEAADVVFLNDAPSNVVTAVKISRRTMGIVHENIIFALGVKAIIITLAAAGIVGMYTAIFGDVGVSIIAILNAMRCLSIKGVGPDVRISGSEDINT